MKLFGKDYEVGICELIWGIGAGIGGLATIHRLEKFIRPTSKFVLAEIGIRFLEVTIGLACLDIGSRYGKAADNGRKKGKERREKEKEQKKEDELIKIFSEWVKKKEQEEDGFFNDFDEVKD